MLPATILLLAIGVIGAFDIAYFHTWRGALTKRPECRSEATVHVIRGFVYAAQFLLIPNVRLYGAWYAALVALFVIDAAVAMTDVLLEPKSRESQGGLPRAEYLIHIVLSVLVGALLWSVFTTTWGDWNAPTDIRIAPHLFWPTTVMAAGSIAVSLLEALSLWESTWRPPSPLHVSVKLKTSLEALWNFTQDHHRHPTWDHRFTKIVMLANEIKTGTQMRYEKNVLGLTIRGFGRYKLHKPMQQSTFEFWSSDPRSLIRRGAGLWRYTPASNGTIAFATSYTYEVRWGLLGRVIDRLIFRPAMQWYTEQSFRRLARDHFPEGASRVWGARDGKPELA
jgi:hypothetical protein